ncbi:MAG TPA: hypothetical protein VHC22_15945 [Pirellulales bacterium]|nr:hypothetical protein [Pirellulales bacterium]
MRTAVLTAVVLVWSSLFLTSRADAQVGVYTMNAGSQVSVYPPFGYGGVYPGQTYLAQGQAYSAAGYTGQVYGAPLFNTGQVYTVPYAYSAPYGYSTVGYGTPGYYPAPVYNNPYYGGFLRYAQYRNRRYGGGHMFYSYFPQYQSETTGIFDR